MQGKHGQCWLSFGLNEASENNRDLQSSFMLKKKSQNINTNQSSTPSRPSIPTKDPELIPFLSEVLHLTKNLILLYSPHI